MRPGPSRFCAIRNPSPGSPSVFSTGMRTFEYVISQCVVHPRPRWPMIGTGSIVSVRTDTSTTPPGHVERIAYDAAGLYVTYESAGASARQFAAGRSMVLETTWPSFRTPQGVHVGSSLAAVRAIPGVRCFTGVCQHGYVAKSGGTSFLVDPVHKKVVRIVVSFGR